MIELDQLETVFFVLLGLVALILVLLISYVVSAGRRQRPRPAPPQEADVFVLDTTAPATGQLLALVRGEPGSAVQVEVDGVRYRRMADIQDAQIRRQVIEAATALIRFTGVLGTESVEPAPVDKTYSWREDLRKGSRAELERAQAQPDAVNRSVAGPDQDVEERFLNLLADLGATPPLEKPSLASALQYRRSKAVQPERPRTFVDDIEEIVQRKLALSAALTGRDLHVRLGPGETVRFVFEGQEFESVDDIPNLTARQLVKDSIREWDETA